MTERHGFRHSRRNVYSHLKLQGVHQGIATVLGIFDDSEGCACALVLLYAGVPPSQANLLISDW